MNKNKILLFCVVVEALIITSIAIATLFSGIKFALFYNVIYGLILSLCLPLYITVKSKEVLSNIGIKKLGIKQVIVLIVFVLFSVGGQLTPKVIAKETIAWELLPICIMPLIMTTFFEEFLFRGFIQTKVERIFGSSVAIIISGLSFSLYHLGYPGFRNVGDILLLFAVGIGFALAYKLSDNNLIVAYFVNLPNAFITYLLKSEQFPIFNVYSTIYAFVTIIIIILIVSISTHKMHFK